METNQRRDRWFKLQNVFPRLIPSQAHFHFQSRSIFMQNLFTVHHDPRLTLSASQPQRIQSRLNLLIRLISLSLPPARLTTSSFPACTSALTLPIIFKNLVLFSNWVFFSSFIYTRCFTSLLLCLPYSLPCLPVFGWLPSCPTSLPLTTEAKSPAGRLPAPLPVN